MCIGRRYADAAMWLLRSFAQQPCRRTVSVSGRRRCARQRPQLHPEQNGEVIASAAKADKVGSTTELMKSIQRVEIGGGGKKEMFDSKRGT
jgi:hypothetical protein